MISHNCLNKKNRYNYFCQWKFPHVGFGSRTRVNLYIVSCWKLFVCVCVLMKWLIFHSDFPTNISIQLLIKNIHSLDELRMVRTFLSMIIHFIKSQVFFSFTQLSCFLFSFFFFMKDFSVDVILRQRWTDRRLKFNHSTVGVLELDQKMTEKVWVPDSFFPKEKRAQIHEVTVPNRLLHIYSNGTVFYSMR